MTAALTGRLAARALPLAALLAALPGCAKEEPQAERPPSPVTVAEVVTRDVPEYLDEIGRCAAREVVSVRPQVAGKITAVHFADGADLKKGDPLFTIDPRPYQALVDQAEAGVAQNRAQRDLARLDYERVLGLYRNDAMPKQDLEAKRSAYAVAEAQLKLGVAALETARLNLEYCTIKAPLDGRAGHRLVDVGNVVAAVGAPPLLVIHRLDPIYVDFDLTETDLPAVRKHLAGGRLKVEARDPDGPAESRTGEVSFLDNAVQEGTGNVRLRAEVPNRDRFFWPGQFVRVRLLLGTHPAAVLVPAEAVQLSQKGPFVYVVQADSTVEMRPVRPGQRHGDLVAVAGALKAGEEVVVSGHLTLSPGAAVQVRQGGES